MINALPLFHRIRGRKVLVLGESDAAEAKRRLVERAGGVVESDMDRAIEEGVGLAFVALDDAEACEAAAAILRDAGMLVNVVDQPELCDFMTPSILDRDPVLIAVGTGGASAGLAKHLRLRLEQFLPLSLGELAQRLFGARDKLRDRYPDGADRRHALDEALREGGELDPLKGDAHNRVDAWLERGDEVTSPETKTIDLSSDDPEDLTLKQARWLGEADTLLLDGDIPEAILNRSRADAMRVPYSEQAKNKARDGLTIILRAKYTG